MASLRVETPRRNFEGATAMIKYPGYEEAVIGPAYVRIDKQMVNVLVYDAEKIREILKKRDGMSHEEAREHIEFNIEGGYLGPETPILVWSEDIWDEDDEE
jgi:hypothetical protein